MLNDFLMDGFAVGFCDGCDLYIMPVFCDGVLVGILVDNAFGEAENTVGLSVIATVGDGFMTVGLRVAIVVRGTIGTMGFFDATDVVGALDIDGTLVNCGEADGVLIDLAMEPILIISRLNNAKLTDPRPVVGSQPVVALKPSEQQGILRPTAQLLCPSKTSIMNA